MRFESFLVFVFLWPILVYYPVVHWVWNEQGGWLYKLGVCDFAGGLTINVTTGVSAFLISCMLKKRLKYITSLEQVFLIISAIGLAIDFRSGRYTQFARTPRSRNDQ